MRIGLGRSAIVLSLGALALAAVALGAPRGTSAQDLPPAGVIAVQQRAALDAGVTTAEADVLRSEHVIWNNGCLGIEPSGSVCTLAIVEGWAVWVSTDDGATVSRYHANFDGSTILLGEEDIEASTVATAGLPSGAAPAGEGGVGDVFVGDAPEAGSIALLTTSQAVAATALIEGLGSAGCDVESVAILEEGRWLLYIPNAPAVVNAAFPQSLAQLTPFFVRCHVGQPPTAGAPAAPTAVTLTGALPDLSETVPPGSGELGRITVSWQSSGTVEGFRVYTEDCDGTVTLALEVGPDETSYGPLSPCRPGGNVGVSAFDVGGESTVTWAAP